LDPNHRCVLVVEDDDDLREALATFLRLEGHHVRLAVDGIEAIEQLQQRPLPDAILLDLLMHPMGGDAFLRALRAQEAFSAVPVVVITGVQQPPEATLHAADAHLLKPFELDDLRTLLERLWSERAADAPRR
jgi:CheY-like chemotaxis protein